MLDTALPRGTTSRCSRRWAPPTSSFRVSIRRCRQCGWGRCSKARSRRLHSPRCGSCLGRSQRLCMSSSSSATPTPKDSASTSRRTRCRPWRSTTKSSTPLPPGASTASKFQDRNLTISSTSVSSASTLGSFRWGPSTSSASRSWRQTRCESSPPWTTQPRSQPLGVWCPCPPPSRSSRPGHLSTARSLPPGAGPTSESRFRRRR
mmetsp:Transcript_33218/g.78685  ORF Transcript_33218/g.78685 Transcript_33218/m.78685 type:complete len:205 (+) Transcript_33218:80-694(+)